VSHGFWTCGLVTHVCWVHIIISEVAFDVDELELESDAWRTSLTLLNN